MYFNSENPASRSFQYHYSTFKKCCNISVSTKELIEGEQDEISF